MAWTGRTDLKRNAFLCCPIRERLEKRHTNGVQRICSDDQEYNEVARSIYGFDIKLTSKVASSMELYTSRRPGRAVGLNSRHQFWIDQFLEAAESN